MRLLSFVCLIGLLAPGCGDSSAPSSPSPNPSTNLSGSWTGSSTDSNGQQTMTWMVAQDGASMTGTMSFGDPDHNRMGRGTMQGTLNGRTVTFHLEVPNGGFSGMMSSCSMWMDGQALVSDDGRTMTGTYSGHMAGVMAGGVPGQACGGALRDGHFTLTR